MGIEEIKAIKKDKAIKEHKSNGFWGFMFWIAPFMTCGALIVGLGPILGTLLAIIVVALCIPLKTRLYMYYVFSALVIFLGITGGFGGIIISIIFCLGFVGVCVSNYEYAKQEKLIKEYDDNL